MTERSHEHNTNLVLILVDVGAVEHDGGAMPERPLWRFTLAAGWTD
jgi:hypothetical protein